MSYIILIYTKYANSFFTNIWTFMQRGGVEASKPPNLNHWLGIAPYKTTENYNISMILVEKEFSII